MVLLHRTYTIKTLTTWNKIWIKDEKAVEENLQKIKIKKKIVYKNQQVFPILYKPSKKILITTKTTWTYYVNNLKGLTSNEDSCLI